MTDAAVLAIGAGPAGPVATAARSGFGGGGTHRHRAPEGTLLDGCPFSGRQTGHALA